MKQEKVIRTLRSLRCFFAGLVFAAVTAAGLFISRPELDFAEECLAPEEEPKIFI